MLHGDPDVSSYLRRNFILHWSSERPVPKVRVDYGDGRVWETTLTGNSIHYVLDKEGNVFDALPGLWDPVSFVLTLENVARRMKGEKQLVLSLPTLSATEARDKSEAERATRLSPSKAMSQARVVRDVATDSGPNKAAAATSPAGTNPVHPVVLQRVLKSNRYSSMTSRAARAVEISISKCYVEAEVIRKIGMPSASQSPHRQPEVRIHPKVVERIRARASETGADPDAMVNAFLQTLELDTLAMRQMREQILVALSTGQFKQRTFDEVNAWVYDKLFLTPASDPWLGMRNTNAWDGIHTEHLDEPIDENAESPESR